MSRNNYEKAPSAADAAFGITNHDVVVEEPEMRSVAVMSFGAPQLSKGGPPVGLKPLSLKSSSRGGSVTIRREWNEANWKVSLLDPVPLDFPLERTRREIQNVSATEVADRISKTLQLLSVEAEYDGKKAKAKCKTSDLVSFRIRLYAGDESLQQPVIVEIQRRSGSPSCFMRVCRQILDGAEGAEIEAETVSARKWMPSYMKTAPVNSLKCIQNAAVSRNPDEEASSGLRKSLDLLRSKEKDINLLGLENLCHITDPLKTRPDIALICCKEIMSGNYSSEIRDEIGVLLQKDVFIPEEFDESSTKELIDKCRHMALCLLSNVFDMTSKDGCLSQVVKTDQLLSDLIFTLLDEVRSFETSSNNAYEATCSLTCLAVCSDVASSLMLDHGAVEELKEAYEFARSSHVLLANESIRCLKALGRDV